MCYWYADSTFEVLVDIGHANVCVNGQKAQKKGVFSRGGIKCIAYTGITRKSLMENMGPGSTHTSENNSYEQQLVDIQGRLIKRYGSVQIPDPAQLPTAERQSIEQNGWNLAQFLGMIQDMPTHQKLLHDSIARDREVQEILEKVSSTVTTWIVQSIVILIDIY